MKKITIALLSSLLMIAAGSNLKAQSPNPHIIKLNLFALGLSNISLQYEQGFHNNMSFAGGIAVLPSRTLPSRITDGVEDSSGTIANLKLNGFSATPEIRFYPGKKEKRQAPKGFYLAPYLRYTKYSMSSIFSFEDSSTVPPKSVPVDMKISYSGFGGGLMIGCQWMIKDRVSIDWWILGIHAGSGKVTGELTSSIIAQNKAEFEEQLSDIEAPRGTVKTSVSGETAKIKLSGFPFGGIRTGLCIGIAF